MLAPCEGQRFQGARLGWGAVRLVSYRDILRAQLRVDEGVRRFPYQDTVGKTTVGVGRNLTDKGLSPDEISYLLENDMRDAEADARSLLANFDRLSDVRKAVVCNMAFNLGLKRFAGFRNTLKAIDEGRYDDAARGMLASKWARQVKGRAVRLAEQMRKGE